MYAQHRGVGLRHGLGHGEDRPYAPAGTCSKTVPSSQDFPVCETPTLLTYTICDLLRVRRLAWAFSRLHVYYSSVLRYGAFTFFFLLPPLQAIRDDYNTLVVEISPRLEREGEGNGRSPISARGATKTKHPPTGTGPFGKE